MKHGFDFGRSSLPKDLRAITYFGRHSDLKLPLLNAINKSNNFIIQYALEIIANKGKKKIGFLGFAFKAGTDDLRESPIVTLIELLIGKGYHIQIYDKNVSLSLLRGSNKLFIEEKIPHIAALIRTDIKEVLSFAEIIVVGNKSEEFINILHHVNSNQYVLALVKINDKPYKDHLYEGICW